MLSTRRGLTLIELMAVVAIAGFLMAVLVPKFGSMRQKSAEAQARAHLGRLRLISDQYRYEHLNRPPPHLADLPLATYETFAVTLATYVQVYNRGSGEVPEADLPTLPAPRRRAIYECSHTTDTPVTGHTPQNTAWQYRFLTGDVYCNAPGNDLRGIPYTSW